MPGDSFYSSAEWRATRKAKLRRDPICQSPQCSRKATHVDHIKSRRRGGPDLDPNNLQSLCHSCHNAKTIRVDGGFGRKATSKVPGCDVNGNPVDPSHHWRKDL